MKPYALTVKSDWAAVELKVLAALMFVARSQDSSAPGQRCVTALVARTKSCLLAGGGLAPPRKPDRASACGGVTFGVSNDVKAVIAEQ